MPRLSLNRHRNGVTALLSSLIVMSCSIDTALAESPFDTAVKSYNMRNYRQAITQFNALKSTYPNNATIRYYLALSYQSVGNRGQAKAEYEWVAANDRTQLKQMAEKGLQVLGAAGSSATNTASASASTADTNSPPVSSSPKVKTIIDFYTDWCGPCKRFEPIFEEVKRKYPDITFKRLNAEDTSNANLVEKYNVKAYPTIVQLDGSGKVLQNEAGAPSTAEDFVQMIQKFR